MLKFNETQPDVYKCKIDDLDCTLYVIKKNDVWFGVGKLAFCNKQFKTGNFLTKDEAKTEIVSNLLAGFLKIQQELVVILMDKL